MKRAVIIHCWEGTPEYCWYPWLKRELESFGFKVEVPAMPDSEHPKQGAWIRSMKKILKEPDKELILIGHSVGCITIMRYLESLKKGQKIGGTVFVAGFTDDLGYKELKNYFKTPINYRSIKSHCPKFISIHSDNDPFVALKHADVLNKKLDAEIIVKQNMGHFSGEVDDEQSCSELPEVFDAVLRI
jgi:hypothetical protein